MNLSKAFPPVLSIFVGGILAFCIFWLPEVVYDLYEIDAVDYKTLAEYVKEQPELAPLVQEKKQDGKITNGESSAIKRQYYINQLDRELNK